MTPDVISGLLTEAGPWVLLIVSLMVGWLHPKRTIDDKDRQITKLEGQVEKRDEEIQKLRELVYRATNVAKTSVDLASDRANGNGKN